MADISKISPDDGSTILNIKDSNAVHWTVENGNTSSSTMKKGTAFLRNNQLCTASANINIGDTFILNSNYNVRPINTNVLINRGTLGQNDNLDDFDQFGVYRFDGEKPIHAPNDTDITAWFMPMLVIPFGNLRQILFYKGFIYMRQRAGNPPTWTNWWKIAGTLLS